MTTLDSLTPDWLIQHPLLHTFLALVMLFLLALAVNFLVKKCLVMGVDKVLKSTFPAWYALLSQHTILKRLANVVPMLVIWVGIEAIPHFPAMVVAFLRNICAIAIIFSLTFALSTLLDFLNALYLRRENAITRPIKGYIQILQIVLYAIASILAIATLIDRSPLLLLSGLGALAAVLILIFQDTLLSLVASVQISSSGMIHIGDWIEMPQLNVDGEVVDIALHTITIRNWDKTLSTVPTKRFISDSFKNWRGMVQSGGRRIKRCLYIDQNSVHFLTGEELSRLHRFMLLDDYLDRKEAEINSWNKELHDDALEPVNTRRITNLGSFRAYIEQYLRKNPFIHQGLTIMVRQLAPGSHGLALELYCFSNDIRWTFYEGIQADIFDHLLAILPEFGLRVFQYPSGVDLRFSGSVRPFEHSTIT